MSVVVKLFLYFLVVILGLLFGTEGCDDPTKIATVEQKVGFSHIVIQGTVISHYTVGSTPELFTAEVEVHCVFKDQGRRIAQFLNISRVGSESGKCFSNELNIAEEYVIFLRNLSTRFETPEKEFSVKNSQDYKDLQTACGMSIVNKYPEGITEKNSPIKCPAIKGHDCPPPKHFSANERTKRPPKRKGFQQGERTTNLIATVTDMDSVGAAGNTNVFYGLLIMSMFVCRTLH